MTFKLSTFSRKILIASLAVWFLFCAFGSSFLHESIGCSHDGSAETVEHQEVDEAHWAAVTSDDFSNSDCPVCITTEAFGSDAAGSVSFRFADASRPLDDAPDSSARACRSVIGSPRAPPSALTEI